MTTRFRTAGPALAAAFVLTSCTPDAARISAPEAALRSSDTYGAVLLECPNATVRSASAVIGSTGGSVQLDNHRLNVPAGAVKGRKRTFTLTVPASNYMDVEIRADGQEHFTFDAPVSVTIDYSRCTRQNILKDDLHIFHIDPVTKEILDDMGGVDDKTATVVTTGTDHLSGYAIGQGRTDTIPSGT